MNQGTTVLQHHRLICERNVLEVDTYGTIIEGMFPLNEIKYLYTHSTFMKYKVIVVYERTRSKCQ